MRRHGPPPMGLRRTGGRDVDHLGGELALALALALASCAMGGTQPGGCRWARRAGTKFGDGRAAGSDR